MASNSPGADKMSDGWNLELDWWNWCCQPVANKGDRMDETFDPDKRELEGRFDAVGWGLLFILFGVLALPKGDLLYASVAAVGGAMLGLNVVRIMVGVPIRWFSVFLGAAILIAGGGALASLHMDAFLVFFLLAGVVTIASALLKQRRVMAAR